MRSTPLRAVVLSALLLVLGTQHAAAAAPPDFVTSDGQTAAVSTPGDAADDPAIWVDHADPARSLVIGNNKLGALETYDLAGRLVQRISDAKQFWGNVDVRGNLVATYHDGGVRIFKVDASTRRLSNVTEGGVVPTSGEGLCLYRAPRGDLHVFIIARSSPSLTRQYELTDADSDGLFAGKLRRTFDVGSEAEGCVVDDHNGALYVSEEDVALWRYGAEPASGATRVAVGHLRKGVGSRLKADLEGVTLAGDRIIVSVQSTGTAYRSYFAVYDRTTNAYVGAFRVTKGANSDDCDGTDGVAAYAGYLGPRFPDGLFVCQDQHNQSPTANQNFKLVRWDRLPD